MHQENFLSGWPRDDTEGKAEEVVERNRKEQEKEAKVEERGEGGGERVDIDGIRVCFGFRF